MKTRIKDVYLVSDREEEEQSTWPKIGVAFVNDDASLNVILDAVPITGHIHIRDRCLKKQKQYKGKQ